jgi:outer membrane protein OmpA-like peptidoglycan-associated protein
MLVKAEKKIKITFLFIFSVLFHFGAFAFEEGKNEISQDSIIKMHGYVYDTIGPGADKSPVGAKLVFESIPYGSEIGIISSSDSTGYYEFYVNYEKSYNVKINSGAHRGHFEKLEISSLKGDIYIRKDFYLQPDIREDQVFRLNRLIFDQGESTITSESYSELNRLASLMDQNRGMVIQLEGHTDFRGSKRLNMELSKDRVTAVKSYLVSQGIHPRRIKTKAFGGTQPLTKEGSIEAASINRRVEVRIVKIN